MLRKGGFGLEVGQGGKPMGWILCETAVCSYSRGTKDKGVVAGPPGTPGEPRREESLVKGSAGHEQI